MASVHDITPFVEPIRKSVVVRRKPEEAFEIFTARLASWWPYTQFSIHQGETATCAIEPRVGGEVYEVSKGGERATWGRILEWEPPRRFAMSWHPGVSPDAAQVVELRFTAVAEGTRVDLEHRDWTRLGADAAEARKNYDGGWATVFEQCYLEACA
jgi:uncharacterized protein YndB with AHSA1/START domain